MKYNVSIICLLLFLSACSDHEPVIEIKDETNSFGLNVPIILKGDTNTIFLSDFFKDVSLIDSLKAPTTMTINWHKGQNEALIIGEATQWLSAIEVFSAGNKNLILLKEPLTESVQIEFDPHEVSYERVAIVGDFNGWSDKKNPLTFKNNLWQVDLQLFPGGYAYKLSLDGKYALDPKNPDSVSNGFGSFNSRMNVVVRNRDKIPHISSTLDAQSKIQILSSVNAVHWIVMWQNQITYSAYNEVGQVYAGIPEIASSKERSYIRVWAQNEFGLSNEVKIPLHFGVPILNASQLAINDKERMIMYFMMVDRFVNGDSSNDSPVKDPRVMPKANYFGGDLEGIRKKIETGYFDQLGINTLWISPINQNPEGAYQEYPEPQRWFSGYHGYWPISFKKVDHRFGNARSLHNLVDEAHEKNYAILLDYVCNHVHEEHPIIKQHPEWKTELNLPDGRKNIRIWDEHRLTTWFDEFMPSLDYSRAEVINIMSDSAIWWMSEFGFDGFRHDATKHIPETFWRAETVKLKRLGQENGKNYFQVGETFGSRELIQSYIGSGMMDGQFDFNLYFDAVSVFKDTTVSFQKLRESLESTLAMHGNLHLMCNITGNHDLPRFISLAGKSLKDNEDQKEAGWQREIKVEDPIGYAKLKMLETFIMTIPGIPVIYYGDEIGMVGANDPDNRRMMKFEQLSEKELDVMQHVETLTTIRSSNLALLFGDLTINQCDHHAFVFTRSYLNDDVITAFNNSAKELQIKVPNAGIKKYAVLDKHSAVEISGSDLILVLAPFSSQIIYSTH